MQPLLKISVSICSSSCSSGGLYLCQVTGKTTIGVGLVTTTVTLSTSAGTCWRSLVPLREMKSGCCVTGCLIPLWAPTSPIALPCTDSWCRRSLWFNCPTLLAERNLTEITGCISCLHRQIGGLTYLNPSTARFKWVLAVIIYYENIPAVIGFDVNHCLQRLPSLFTLLNI